MRARGAALIAAAVTAAAVAAACGRGGFGGGGGTQPTATPDLAGDGRDGALDVTDAQAFEAHGGACAVLLGTTGKLLSLETPLTVTPGDRLLLLQVTDSAFAISGDPAPVTDPRGAGNWTMSTVAADTAGFVTLASAPSYAFGSVGNRHAQACRVPQFSTVTLRNGGDFHATPWDGTTHGVVALYASSLLIVESGGRIEADAAGFRGGVPNPAGDGTSNIHGENTLPNQGGGKGEGIDPSGWSALWGRGNLANAAGGGNGHNAGGGGGANGGAGGFGGSQEFTYDTETRGRGGAPLVVPSPLARIFFGGGGASGQWDSGGGTHPPGGNGGGLVLLLTPHAGGAGVLSSKGAPGGLSNQDGSSGAGAGGTVVVLSPDGAGFNGAIDVTGGRGGDNNANVGGERAPGGGGAGGTIVLRPAGSFGTSATYSLSGGLPGTLSSGVSTQSWGATNGSAGTISR